MDGPLLCSLVAAMAAISIGYENRRGWCSVISDSRSELAPQVRNGHLPGARQQTANPIAVWSEPSLLTKLQAMLAYNVIELLKSVLISGE